MVVFQFLLLSAENCTLQSLKKRQSEMSRASRSLKAAANSAS